MDKKDENYLVSKHNDIVEASYSLSIAEQRLLLACVSRLDSRKDSPPFDCTKPIVLTVDDFQGLFYGSGNRSNAFRDLRNASEKLYDRAIRMISRDGKEEILTRWVSTVSINHDDMTVSLFFHSQIMPYISQLESNYTCYRIKHVAHLSSVYAIRVYEMLVSWHGQNKISHEMTIDDFRDSLDLKGKHKMFGHLKSRVIDEAVKQINADTNFSLEITATKKGRSYNKLQFKFSQKSDDIEIEQAHKANRIEKNIEKKKAKQDRELIAKKERDAQQQLQSFFDYSRTVEINTGMRFYSETAKKTYEVIEGNIINAPELKTLGVLINKVPMTAYRLDEESILRLLYQNELRLPRENEND